VKLSNLNCLKEIKVKSTKNRLRRPTGRLEVYLYSFFNFDARKGCVVTATPLSLYLREGDSVPIIQKAGWAPGPVRI